MQPRKSSYSLTLILAFLALLTNVASAADKPIIIVFLSDDVGYGEYGFQGSKDVPTPHIDSIAKNGVRFTQGYVAATYCSPCRAGLMTGRYPTRFGHEFNDGGAAGTAGKFGLPIEEKTIANRMRDLGYATAAIGKWHLGGRPGYTAVERGFDEFYGTVANTPFLNPPNFIDSRIANKVSPVMDDSFYTTDAYAARAVDWLSKQKDKPFFLYLPFNAQHAPLQAPEKYLSRFPELKDKRKSFAAMMSAMDDGVGAVLEQVRKMGQEENTLIFFFSDNGGPTAQTTSKNGVLRGVKATTLEGGIRVPFCAQWKGKIAPGMTYENPIQNLDILPTAIAAAGGDLDPSWKLDGVDLLPFLTGKNTAKPHETLYWRFGEQWAVRHGDWKLCANRIDGVKNVKLFNLKDDVGESKDLSSEQPEKVKELKSLWDRWSSEQMEPRWKPQAQAARRNAANQNQ